LKKLDLYIIKKFLGTFFFALLLIVFVAVIFDLSEHLEDFIEKKAPLRAILFEYYLNFIPYFANLFSSLFTFIAVIFFTSKMAFNTEIVAILSSGISFRRMMFPYFVSAVVISVFSFVLSSYIIPPANKARLDFEERYIRNFRQFTQHNFHKQIEPGIAIYLERYNTKGDVGIKFSMEKFENNELKIKLNSEMIQWDSLSGKWKIKYYRIRYINDSISEKIETGNELDTLINLHPSEFRIRDNIVETMNYSQLSNFIEEQRAQGIQNIETYLIEKYRRIAFPFATFILTLIGVSLASRKVKGGIGLHIGLGFLFSFSYILFMQISTTFAISGQMNTLLSVWIPNIVYAIIAIFLYKVAPK